MFATLVNAVVTGGHPTAVDVISNLSKQALPVTVATNIDAPTVRSNQQSGQALT